MQVDFIITHTQISIHAPREGCDPATWKPISCRIWISIHAPREGCDGYTLQAKTGNDISIHAPREGCDNTSPAIWPLSSDFNPRTP